MPLWEKTIYVLIREIICNSIVINSFLCVNLKTSLKFKDIISLEKRRENTCSFIKDWCNQKLVIDNQFCLSCQLENQKNIVYICKTHRPLHKAKFAKEFNSTTHKEFSIFEYGSC